MNHLPLLQHFHPIGEAEYALVSERLQPRSYKKGSHIVTPGQTQKELLFVKTGIQMSYAQTDHKDHVIAFTYAPGICAIPESFSFQKPSPHYLKCLSDSEFDALSYTALQQILDQSPALERLFRRMAETILVGVINRHVELHALGMEERYKIFCRRSPHLLQLVPHKYIASYLGIDSTNFSKLFNTVTF